MLLQLLSILLPIVDAPDWVIKTLILFGLFAAIAVSFYNRSESAVFSSNNEVNIYIEKALTINPNTVRAYTVKAQIFEKQKNWDKAKECFEKAIALNPNDATAHHHFATYYRR